MTILACVRAVPRTVLAAEGLTSGSLPAVRIGRSV